MPIAGLRTEADADDADVGAAAAAEPLPLFDAVQRAFDTPASKGQGGAPKRRRLTHGKTDAKSEAGAFDGAVLNVGGPVWALDWSPATPAQHAGGRHGNGGSGAGGSGAGGAATAAGSRQDDSGAAEPYSSQFLAVNSSAASVSLCSATAMVFSCAMHPHCAGLNSAAWRHLYTTGSLDTVSPIALRSQRTPEAGRAM